MTEGMRKWIDTLRSGRYDQGYGQLRTATPLGRVYYCCLGVACEVYRKSGNPGEWNSETCFSVGDERSITGLPRPVANWLGLDDPDPALTDDVGGYKFSAIRANDDDNWPFDQIADALEKRYS